MAKGESEIVLEQFFRALADRTRLRLINLMDGGEVCVCFFVQVLGVSQPKISRHLAYLRRVGVVASRREGKWMHYRVVEPAGETKARVFGEVRAWLREEPEMRRDRERLVKMCCAPRLPVQLQGAPRPQGLTG
ncbi:MAG: ArsR/SmtB family transcription factor [Pyrinomonadaceae bacterium]